MMGCTPYSQAVLISIGWVESTHTMETGNIELIKRQITIILLQDKATLLS
jgi:hypothetical protein